MAAKKSRPQRFAAFDEQLAKDHDPEADRQVDDSDASQSGEDSDHANGTEHYVSVGKSKLRQTDPVSLGPQYRGKRVSRAALDDSSEEDGGHDEEDEGEDEEVEGDELQDSEEFDDPEEAENLDLDHLDDLDGDEEIDSDDALCESDQERFAKFTFRGSSHPQVPSSRHSKRPVAADFLSSSDSDSEDGAGEGDVGTSASDGDSGPGEEGVGEDEEEDDVDDSDLDEDVSGSGDEDDSSDASDEDDGGAERAELRKIMSEGQKSIVATMSEAARADVDKGRAVRQQRRSFDALLNIRIRLQKALVAANSLGALPLPSGGDSQAATEVQEPYQAAEEAALKLWSSIETFREKLTPSSSSSTEAAGQKRKRPTSASLDTSLEDLWAEMEAVESRAASHRRRVLEKWSSRVRNTTATATTRKLGAAAPVQTLTSLLDDQLANPDRLVKRTRVPRSCAPDQAARKVGEDAEVYDDADFYQLLLKELVDQRTMDPSASSGPGTMSSLASAVPTVRWATAAAREARTRKTVDRRASKGRRMRFTVHEKLQNFMAPEDRRGWEQDAIDRFFGTLFGQKMEVLREDEDGSDADEELGGASLEEQGLRLFRS